MRGGFLGGAGALSCSIRSKISETLKSQRPEKGDIVFHGHTPIFAKTQSNFELHVYLHGVTGGRGMVISK